MNRETLSTVAQRFKEYFKYGPQEQFGEIETKVAYEFHWKMLLFKLFISISIIGTMFLVLAPERLGEILPDSMNIIPALTETDVGNRMYGYLLGAALFFLFRASTIILRRLPGPEPSDADNEELLTDGGSESPQMEVWECPECETEHPSMDAKVAGGCLTCVDLLRYIEYEAPGMGVVENKVSSVVCFETECEERITVDPETLVIEDEEGVSVEAKKFDPETGETTGAVGVQLFCSPDCRDEYYTNEEAVEPNSEI